MKLSWHLSHNNYFTKIEFLQVIKKLFLVNFHAMTQSWNEKLWFYANFTVIWSINEEKLDASICMAHKTTQTYFMHITKRIIYNEMTEKNNNVTYERM